MLLTLLFGGCVVFVVSRAHKFLTGLQSVGYAPGLRPAFHPLSILGVIIPTMWWNPGLNWSWEWRKTTFFNHSYDVISMVPFLLGAPCYYTGSLNVIKQLLGQEGKTHLVKPRELTTVLLLWGDNVFSANDEMWKRHRRVVAPAFTTRTYALVWKEAITTYNEMVAAEDWDTKGPGSVVHINPLTTKFALIMISRCGFGLPMPWVDTREGDNELTWSEALGIVSKTAILRLITPRWVYALPIQRLREIERAWTTLSKLMHEFIMEKKQELAAQNSVRQTREGDVFTQLVSAYDENAKFGLEEQEVIGNVFTLMFAGHETTATVLAVTLGYLAIHQDEQEKAYREIQEVIPQDCDPEMGDIPKLSHVFSCFLEAGRLFPTASLLTRDMTEDVPIKVSHPAENTIILKKGNRMIIDMIGVHRNPHTFPDPHEFRPSRWYGVSEQDLSIFGVGPRACIGRKFAETEAICFLSLFLRDWKCDIILDEGETRQQYEDRVMGNGGGVGLTLGVGPVSLRLTKRV
ncbi:cytochrome P450 [Ramaria rubella]|nr:cytochrome P450 [Ramaria rubella]